MSQHSRVRVQLPAATANKLGKIGAWNRFKQGQIEIKASLRPAAQHRAAHASSAHKGNFLSHKN
jgi:hypothetical protein